MNIKSYLGAGLVLFVKEGTDFWVLLEKRYDDHTWAIPGGGYSSKDNNDLSLTAIRETFEETGIRVESASFLKTYKTPFFRYDLYSAQLDEKVTPVRNWESEEIKWFKLWDLPSEVNWMTKIELKDFYREEINKCGPKRLRNKQ